MGHQNHHHPSITVSSSGKLAKSRKRKAEPSRVVQEPLGTLTSCTTPGHALNSFGFSSTRQSTRSSFLFSGACMDHLNGGTRMLPGRRVLSSVRSTNGTQESKEA